LACCSAANWWALTRSKQALAVLLTLPFIDTGIDRPKLNFGTDFLYGGLSSTPHPDTGVEMRPIQKTSWSCCPTEFANAAPSK
jgi:hypothetical protein